MALCALALGSLVRKALGASITSFGPLQPWSAGTILFGGGDSSYMHIRTVVLAILVLAMVAFAQNTADVPFQVSVAANPSAGESPVNITNSGASAGGNICVSVYTLLPSAQMVSCCSCQVAPDSLVTLGVNKDLTNNTAVNTSVVIKLVATTPGGTCAASAGTQGTLANGLVAYLTTLQVVGNTNTYNAVNQTFVPSSLSAAEYTHLTNVCTANFGGGGLCSSCNPAPRH